MELVHHRAGQGAPLVLIHGIGSRWQLWEPVLPRLEAEREVVAIDLPGFGASPPPPPATPPGIDSLTTLVSEFLDRAGLERPHVAGNSMGGWVALELARRGRVASAAALSPAGFHNRREALYQHATLWTTARLTRAMAPAADTLMRSPARRRMLLNLFFGHPERVPAADAAASVRALAHAPWFDAMLPAITGDHFPARAPIDVPVTIAWGEHDRLLVRRQALRALRAIPGAQLVLLHGCGHAPTYDDPDLVARVLLQASAGAG